MRGGAEMIVYLPCRLGEQFTPLKFKGWVNDERVYDVAPPKILQGFCDSLFNPDVYAGGEILSYDQTGRFGKGYEPKYKVSIDFGKTAKLCEMGFPGNRTVKLYGIILKDGKVMAEFVTIDRYEHLYYPIKDNLRYSGLDEAVKETDIEYCKIKKVEKQITLFDLGVK